MKDESSKSNVTLPARVEKIIKSAHPGEPEKVEIHVLGGDPLYEEIRVDNSLTNKEGEEVRLKQGAEVKVTVEASAKATSPKNRVFTLACFLNRHPLSLRAVFTYRRFCRSAKSTVSSLSPVIRK
jgi:hypothetical protein